MDHHVFPTQDCDTERNYLLIVITILGAAAGLFVLLLLWLTCGWCKKRGKKTDIELGEHKNHHLPDVVVIWPENETPAVTSEHAEPSRNDSREVFEEIDLSSVRRAQAVPIVQVHRAESDDGLQTVLKPPSRRPSVALRTVDMTSRARLDVPSRSRDGS